MIEPEQDELYVRQNELRTLGVSLSNRLGQNPVESSIYFGDSC